MRYPGTIANCSGWGSRRRRSSVEFPRHPFRDAVRSLPHLVGRAPEQAGQARSRWKLETIRAACPWLEPLTLSGVWRVLDRLKLDVKRGRDYLLSPDADYLAKLADVITVFEQAFESEGRIVLLFSDEMTFYRQPSLVNDYALEGASIV